MAYGWHRQVIRTSIAADKLALAGFGHEAGPLRRSMIEHMAFLVWLSDDEPAALAVLNDSTIKSTKDLAQYEVGYDIGNDPAWLNEADFSRHTDTYLGKVTHLLPKYQLNGMKVPWLIEPGCRIRPRTRRARGGINGRHRRRHGTRPRTTSVTIPHQRSASLPSTSQPWSSTATWRIIRGRHSSSRSLQGSA